MTITQLKTTDIMHNISIRYKTINKYQNFALSNCKIYYYRMVVVMVIMMVMVMMMVILMVLLSAQVEILSGLPYMVIFY